MAEYVMPDSSEHPVESKCVGYIMANECNEKNSDDHSFIQSSMLRAETLDQTIKRNSNVCAMPYFDDSSYYDLTMQRD